MSDLPRADGSWRVLPQDYLAHRPPAHAVSRTPASCHVAMRDNFGQVPHGRPPVLSIRRGGLHASSISLPMRPCPS